MSPDDPLRRYDILMQQNRFEHTGFWSRFGFMLLSQIALFGFFLGQARTANTRGTSELWYSLPLCLLGFAMVALFVKLHWITDWWIKRWLDLIKANEEAAFGHIMVVRGADNPNGSVRRMALYLTMLMGALWVLAAVAMIAAAVSVPKP